MFSSFRLALPVKDSDIRWHSRQSKQEETWTFANGIPYRIKKADGFNAKNMATIRTTIEKLK